jgi:hypothetical protein
MLPEGLGPVAQAAPFSVQKSPPTNFQNDRKPENRISCEMRIGTHNVLYVLQSSGENATIFL